MHVDSDGDGLPDGWENTNSLQVTDGLLSSLTSWWRFDEASGSTVGDDNLLWSNDGTLMNGASHSPEGYARHALELDGDDDYVDVDDHYSLCSTGGLTVALWVKVSSFASTNEPVYFVSKEGAYGRAEYVLSYVKATQSLRFSHKNASDESETVSVTYNMSTGLWVHLAVAVDGNNVAFHVDGQIQGATQTLSYARSNLGDVLIGTTLDTNAVDPTVHGLIDELRLYNTALSSTEISALREAEGDDDSDGLTNRQEYDYGTTITGGSADDAETDSDSDGWTNYDEIVTHGTDPFNSDSDGDGVADKVEQSQGSDPLVADQGSQTNGPSLTVLYPEDGAYVLW